MSRMPDVAWIGPTPNRNPNAMGHIRGLVLHIQDGHEAGSEATLKDPNRPNPASAHFLNPKAGPLRQLVDTADIAWAQAAGNRSWVSVENEGFAGDLLTASQIENCAEILAWLHQECGVPVASTDNPDGAGLGWHGMGGTAWGGHFGCPGEPVKAQRPQIVAYANRLLARPISHHDMEEDVQPVVFTCPGKPAFLALGPLVIGLHEPADLTAAQKLSGVQVMPVSGGTSDELAQMNRVQRTAQ